MRAERELSTDIARGLGIILVVYGHTVAAWGGDNEILHRFIYSFHMPLFFGLSGMYISTNSELIPFIKSKVTRFVIPFIFWVMIYFIFYLTLRIVKFSMQGYITVNEISPILDFQDIKNLCVVPIIANWSSINSAGVYIDLWFIPAIFSTVILYRLYLDSMKHQRGVTTLLFSILLSYIVVYLNNKYGFHNSVPWSIDVAAVCLPFLIISKYRSYAEKLHLITIPILIFAIYYFSRNMTVEVAGLRIENYPKFFLTAICGMALVFLISVKIQFSWAGKILSEVGKRTYLIFLLQGLVFAVFRPVYSRLPLLDTNETLFNYALLLTALACGYLFFPLFSKHTYLRFYALGQK